ncbi:MAG TPA: DedA family protein [Gemmataceae bacterium]|jgi:membrane-associated protein|nr:DedA family protein [Gemmataceae bacterium]
MELIRLLFDTFLHLDQERLNHLADLLGPWLYLVLFLIVFCETGLVVTPVLPGDSLLFAVGAVAAGETSHLSLPGLLILLIVAAVTGDGVNYVLGYRIGPKVFSSEDSRLFNKKHLLRAHRFYEKYGGKTIILARFMPIIRTFAPFVAGIGRMEYRRFSLYNVSGGVAWVAAFLLGGFFLGNTDAVQRHFHIIIVAIVIISVLPAVVELVLARRRLAQASRLPGEPGLEGRHPKIVSAVREQDTPTR